MAQRISNLTVRDKVRIGYTGETVGSQPLEVSGNTLLGSANGHYTHVNDTLYLGATDSGDSHFYFGENTSNWYGLYLNWDSGHRVGWYSRHAGTNTRFMYFDTNNTGYLEWERNFSMNNRNIDHVNQLHFQDNIRFLDAGDDSHLKLRFGDSNNGKLRFERGDGTRVGEVYWDTNGSNFGLLNKDGQWAVKTTNVETALYYDGSKKFRTDGSGTVTEGRHHINGYVYSTSYGDFNGDVKGTRFVDRNNTAYYLNPAETSRLVRIDGDEYKQIGHGNPRNNLGDPTITEMALFDSQFTCKTDLSNDYTDLTYLTFWVQQNEGDAWTEVTVDDTQKKKFLRTNGSNVVIPNRAYKFRVEFHARHYTFANAIYFYWSSNSHNSQVHIWKQRSSDLVWSQHTSSTRTVSSWPGHLYLPFSNIAWQDNGASNKYEKIRVEFTPNWSGHATYGDRDINLYGGQIWGGYPSGRRTPHYYNEHGNVFFPGNLYAEGGTSDNKRLTTRDWITWSNLDGKPTVGDGSFTQKNFTTTLKNKLDGIEAGADVTDATNVSAAGAMLKSGQEKSTAMKEFETTLTNEDDWRNSPISVRERGNVGSAESADKYAPNICFHWGGRSSNSLWMKYNGELYWGGYDASGIPDNGGTFRTTTLYAGSQSITATKVGNWNTAYGWGNHASAGYAASSHNHDDRYFTESEANTRFAYKAGSYSQDFYVNDLYSDQWLKNTVADKGLYNNATTQHFYSSTDDYWNITMGGNSRSGIRIRDAHNSTTRGYFMANTSNQVGILTGAGEWAFKATNNGASEMTYNAATKIATNGSGVTVTGTVTATDYVGDGSRLTGISAGIPYTNAEDNSSSTVASISFNRGELTITMANGATVIIGNARTG